MSTDRQWFVFYTKSRQEKKVRDLLLKSGFETFLPLQKVMRQWSDRKKKVEVPLFSSYIFVQCILDKIPAVLQIPGIAWSVRHNNRPATLHPKEIEIINRFLASGLLVEAGLLEEFNLGEAVEIIDGPLKGLTGIVHRTTDAAKFNILIESIGHTLVATLDPVMLKKR